MDGWNTFSFPFGAFRPIFRCYKYVSFRECNSVMVWVGWWFVLLVVNLGF